MSRDPTVLEAARLPESPLATNLTRGGGGVAAQGIKNANKSAADSWASPLVAPEETH